MKIVGDKDNKFHVEIDAHGVKQIYTFPTAELMIEGCRMYKKIFPQIKLKLVKQPNVN